MGDRARHRELGAVFPQVDRQPSGRHLRHSRHRAARSHARQPCRRRGADARRRDAPEDAAALRGAMTNIVWAAVLALLSSLAMTANEMSCFAAPQGQRAELLPVYKAMFREARSIARYPEQQRVAREICREMYWLRLRPNDPSLPTAEEEVQQRAYLQVVEPACNAPIDDRRERDLLAAIQRGDRGAIRVAAQEGFDFNRLLDGRNLPIVSAGRNGSAAMVTELAAAGAKPDEVGADGRTALDLMVNGDPGPRERRLVVVQALLEAGARA